MSLFLQTGTTKITFRGPLRVSTENPRYFTDDSGKAIFLTGSHTWSNFQDSRTLRRTKPFDFTAYLTFLQEHNHNFIRLWRWELPLWEENDATFDKQNFSSPHPWKRRGTEKAKDGQPKFDLTQFDPDYFALLRKRVLAAQKAGIYVSLMLFEGWAMQFIKNAWQTHPFHPDNHLNSLAGPPADAKGVEIYELKYPEITAVQEAYVRKVIDTISDLDNILYEISNENHLASAAWQNHFVRFIKKYEREKRRHPVGMSFFYYGGDNDILFRSEADWIAPGTYWPSDLPPTVPANRNTNYRDDPPPADTRKVVMLDTDHLWGVGGNAAWVWKSFLRGYNVMCMDTITSLTGFPEDSKVDLEPVRRAMGEVRTLSQKIDLAHMMPDTKCASTNYCLASAGKEYLLYQPDKGPFTADIVPGTYTAEWFDPTNARPVPAADIMGQQETRLVPPFDGPVVLSLRRK